MTWHPDKPYNDLPLLPPGLVLETTAVLKRCIAARATLAELKQAAAQLPNPSMLINTLPVLEARDSSAIENIVTTTDKLFLLNATNGSVDAATQESLRYRKALLEAWGVMSRRPINTNLAESVCSVIKGASMTVRKVPGTTLANSRTGEVITTPPEGHRLLRDLLGNWEKFVNEESGLDPLIRMAVMHYQFEAIHPFTDGNGRTGRILNVLFLVQEELLTLPILHLSRYLLANRNEYYEGLLNVTREQAWEPWLLYMLDAVESSAAQTLQKIKSIKGLHEQTAQRVKSNLPRIYSLELVNLLFVLPYCRIDNFVEAGIAKRQTASTYLSKLVAMEVLQEQQLGREKLFVNTALMRELAAS